MYLVAQPVLDVTGTTRGLLLCHTYGAHTSLPSLSDCTHAPGRLWAGRRIGRPAAARPGGQATGSDDGGQRRGRPAAADGSRRLSGHAVAPRGAARACTRACGVLFLLRWPPSATGAREGSVHMRVRVWILQLLRTPRLPSVTPRSVPRLRRGTLTKRAHIAASSPRRRAVAIPSSAVTQTLTLASTLPPFVRTRRPAGFCRGGRRTHTRSRMSRITARGPERGRAPPSPRRLRRA